VKEAALCPRAQPVPRRKCDAIDWMIGQNIRFHRLRRFMSQAQLGETLGVTYQQIQKYEKGVSPIAASRVFQISRILRIPLERLFAC
jgi:transcriptional regulator with XRE-family HTH domain